MPIVEAVPVKGARPCRASNPQRGSIEPAPSPAFRPPLRRRPGRSAPRLYNPAKKEMHLRQEGPFLDASGCMSCSLVPRPGVPVDGYLFGLNTVLGPIVTLPYDDPELLAAGRALGAGTLRWPGGAVANFWSIKDCNYAASAISDWRDRYDAVSRRPGGTFSPLNFWSGVGSAALGARPPVWVLNVHTLDGDEMLAQVDLLHEQARRPAQSVNLALWLMSVLTTVAGCAGGENRAGERAELQEVQLGLHRRPGDPDVRVHGKDRAALSTHTRAVSSGADWRRVGQHGLEPRARPPRSPLRRSR